MRGSNDLGAAAVDCRATGDAIDHLDACVLDCSRIGKAVDELIAAATNGRRVRRPIDELGACDCGARRRCAGLDRSPGFVPAEGGCRRRRAARAAEAEEATKKADEARLVVFKVSREAAQAMVPVRVAENLKLRAEAQLEASERALASASSAEAKEQAEDARAKAAALAIELSARLATAKAELQPKLDAVGPAREAWWQPRPARAAASEEARKTARDLEPISVFISRKTQHLYVRQGFEPILDIPVTIRDPDRPIGTHVFTAAEHARGDLNMRWSVVSLVSGQSDAGLRDAYDPTRGDSRGNAAVRRPGWCERSARPSFDPPGDTRSHR